MIRYAAMAFKMIFLFILITGCSISDYPGHKGRKTSGEALINYISPSITWYGYGENLDGTYMYTTSYNNRNWDKPNYFNNKIVTYRNEALDSIAASPGIMVDGDSIKGTRGFSGGKFERYWVAKDKDINQSGGMENLDKETPLDENEKWIAPMIISGFAGSVSEVDDEDVNLQSTLKTAGSILKHLFLNSMGNSNMSVAISSVKFGKSHVKIKPFFPVDVRFYDMKIENIKINAKHPAFKSLVKAVLENTKHLKPTDLSLELEGGLSFPVRGLTFAFNHDGLNRWLESKK